MSEKHVILILGGPFLPDGTEARVFFSSRVQHAVDTCNEKFKRGGSSLLVVSGGRPKPMDSHSRAEQLRDLVVQTVGLDKIGPKKAVCSLVIQKNCYNTFEAARGLEQLLKRKRIDLGSITLTVVTSDFHIERTRMIFDHVYESRIKVEYISAPSAGQISEEELIQRQQAEEALIKSWLPQAMEKYADKVSVTRSSPRYKVAVDIYGNISGVKSKYSSSSTDEFSSAHQAKKAKSDGGNFEYGESAVVCAVSPDSPYYPILKRCQCALRRFNDAHDSPRFFVPPLEFLHVVLFHCLNDSSPQRQAGGLLAPPMWTWERVYGEVVRRTAAVLASSAWTTFHLAPTTIAAGAAGANGTAPGAKGKGKGQEGSLSSASAMSDAHALCKSLCCVQFEPATEVDKSALDAFSTALGKDTGFGECAAAAAAAVAGSTAAAADKSVVEDAQVINPVDPAGRKTSSNFQRASDRNSASASAKSKNSRFRLHFGYLLSSSAAVDAGTHLALEDGALQRLCEELVPLMQEMQELGSLVLHRPLCASFGSQGVYVRVSGDGKGSAAAAAAAASKAGANVSN